MGGTRTRDGEDQQQFGRRAEDARPGNLRPEGPTAGAASLVASVTEIMADTTGRAQDILPGLLAEVPVAILLIDLQDSRVTYANQAAVDMAGRVGLPVPLDDWGQAAGLTDLEGNPLETSGSPLSRVATGRPVAGEAIGLPGRDGEDRRVLWVTGFPLSALDNPEQLALVILLEVTRSSDAEAAMAALRDRAVIATDLAFTISDPRKPDNPLVWVNPAFSRSTGWSADEVIGQNCRFLQGDATDPAAIEAIRQAIRQGVPLTVTLLNYRKDGTAFWNQLSISPVMDGAGELVSFVGIQIDVTERVRVDHERDGALQAERAARAKTERARTRLSLLVEATTQLASTLDVSEALARLATIAVPRMADWVVINLVDAQGNLQDVATRHRDGHTDLLDRYVSLQATALTARSGVRRLLSGAEPFVLEEADGETIRGHVSDPALLDVVAALGLVSVLYVPLVARGNRVMGTMTLVSGPSGRHFSADDLESATDLGRRAGLTIDNARLYEQEHRVAETLQRSLLPRLPVVPGTTVAARYLPGEATADVGGDFYDVLPLPDGSIGFAIGDVVGHDLTAAAAMGHLRGLLRACAWDDASLEGGGDPGRVVARVDRLVQGLDVVPLATLFYGCLALHTGPGGEACFTYANAGHPEPLLRLPGGEVHRLDQADGVLLGVTDLGPHRTAQITVPSGSLLLGYTDGLVERRGVDVEEGIRWLQETLEALPAETGPEGVLAHLLDRVGPNRDDDIAVMAIRVDA
jgi:PAS domain S-box-containing protein